MTEPTIVFTHYALLLTATTFTMLGGLVGWAVTSYLRGREIKSLQNSLQDMKISLTEKMAETTPGAAKLSALGKKKDRLLKDFMKRQLLQKKSLDKVTTELEEARNAKIVAERSLNAAHMSLDQWKEKCAALADAHTKLRKSQQTVSSRAPSAKANAVASVPEGKQSANTPVKAPTAVKLPAINITSSRKSVPADKAVIASANPGTTKPEPVPAAAEPVASKVASRSGDTNTAVSANNATPKTDSGINTKINEIAVAEVLAPVKKTNTGKPPSKKAASVNTTTKTKLTTINGIGPAIEKELKKLGIQSVEQLATLKQKEINDIDKGLGKYSGRITRQDWVKQAKVLTKDAKCENAAA